MSKVVLSGYILVPDKDLPVVLQQLPAHIRATRDEPGCLTFDVDQDADNANKFVVYEEFVDAEAFESHQRRAKASSWGRVTGNVERRYQVTGYPK